MALFCPQYLGFNPYIKFIEIQVASWTHLQWLHSAFSQKSLWVSSNEVMNHPHFWKWQVATELLGQFGATMPRSRVDDFEALASPGFD